MSEQVNPVPAEEQEASGLLLSVEPLNEGAKLSATDTVDGGADAGGDTDSTDSGDADGTDAGDADGTDTTSDADGTDVTEKIKDALGMDDDSDSDGTDGGTIRADSDSTDGR